MVGASLSFELACLVETLFDDGAASALASVSVRVCFDRAMTTRDVFCSYGKMTMPDFANSTKNHRILESEDRFEE